MARSAVFLGHGNELCVGFTGEFRYLGFFAKLLFQQLRLLPLFTHFADQAGIVPIELGEFALFDDQGLVEVA